MALLPPPFDEPSTPTCLSAMIKFLELDNEVKQHKLSKPYWHDRFRELADLHEALRPRPREESPGIDTYLRDQAPIVPPIDDFVKAYDEQKSQFARDLEAWEDGNNRLRNLLLREAARISADLRSRAERWGILVDIIIPNHGSIDDSLSTTSSHPSAESGVSRGATTTAISSAKEPTSQTAPSHTSSTTTLSPTTIPQQTSTSRSSTVISQQAIHNREVEVTEAVAVTRPTVTTRPTETTQPLPDTTIQPRPATTQPPSITTTLPQSGTIQPTATTESTTTRPSLIVPLKVRSEKLATLVRQEKRRCTGQLREARPPKRQRQSQNPERILTYDEVRQGDAGEHRYVIVQRSYTHPSDPQLKGSFWVFRCLEHGMHYTSENGEEGTIRAAANHLCKHPELMEKSGPTMKVFEIFGHLVQGCTKDLANQNNEEVTDAIRRKEYVPETRMPIQVQTADKEAHTVNDTISLAEGTAVPDDDAITAEAPVSWPGLAATPITDPDPGELYLVPSESLPQGEAGKYLACLMLHFDDWHDIGVEGSFNTSRLVRNVPSCYKHHNVSLGWKREYRDGGKLVTQRQRPFLCFNNTESIEKCETYWFYVKDLQRFDIDQIEEVYKPIIEEYQRRGASIRVAAEQLANNAQMEPPPRRPWVEEGPRDPKPGPSDGITATGNDDTATSTMNSTARNIHAEHRDGRDEEADLDVTIAIFEVIDEIESGDSDRTGSTDITGLLSGGDTISANRSSLPDRHATPRPPFAQTHSTTPMPQTVGGESVARTSRTLESASAHRQQSPPRCEQTSAQQAQALHRKREQERRERSDSD